MRLNKNHKLQELSCVFVILLLVFVSFFSISSTTGYTITVTWASPSVVSNKDDFDDYLGPMILDDDNNVHVIWCEYYDGINSIEVKYRQLFASSDTWSSIETLSVGGANVRSEKPFLKKDSQGILHLVWKVRNCTDGSENQNYRYYSDNQWSEIFTLSELNITSDCFDFVPFGTNELFFVYDNNFNTSTNELYFRTYNWVTQSYGLEYQLTNSTHDLHYPTVAVDSQQTVHISWTDLADPIHHELHYQNYNGSLNPIEPLIVSEIDILHTSTSKLFIDKNDNVHILYAEVDFPFTEFHYRILANGVLSEDCLWQSGDSISSDYHMFFDSDNTLHLVWSDYQSGPPISVRINYQQQLINGTWSNVLSYTTDAQNGGEPLLAVDTIGKMHVVWSAYVDNDWCIYYISCKLCDPPTTSALFFPVIFVIISLVVFPIIKKYKSNLSKQSKDSRIL